MTFEASWGWTLARALLMAGLTLPLAWGLRDLAQGLPDGRRRILWWLLLVPFLTPPLLTGYAYANFSLSLIRSPGWNETLLMALTVFRHLLVGTVVLWITPPGPLTASALYCAQLAGERPPRAGRGLRLFRARVSRCCLSVTRGPERGVLPAGGVLFLLGFQEFELPSLMLRPSWTVWLFDAQAGGLGLWDSLRFAVRPALVSGGLAWGLWMGLNGTRFTAEVPLRRPPQRGRRVQRVLWCVAGIGPLLVTVIPFGIIGREIFAGLPDVLAHRRMLREVAVSLGFGLGSGGAASLVAVLLLRAWWGSVGEIDRRRLLGLMALLSLPGLMGSLLVSLVCRQVFQYAWIQPLYDSALPAVVAMVVVLLPRALFVHALLGSARSAGPLHLARLLMSADDAPRRRAAREQVWALRHRSSLIASGMVCLWGYLELTPMELLAPPGLTAAPVRLYNLMHYGRSPALSAMLLVVMLAPLAVCGLVLSGRRVLTWSTGSWRSGPKPESGG